MTADIAYDKTVQAFTAQKDCFGTLCSAAEESLQAIKQGKGEYDNQHAETKEEDKPEHEKKHIENTLSKFIQN